VVAEELDGEAFVQERFDELCCFCCCIGICSGIGIAIVVVVVVIGIVVSVRVTEVYHNISQRFNGRCMP